MSKTICAIDDNPDLLANLTEFLRLEGYVVHAFSGGSGALEYLETNVPDLIITDLWMPAMDGLSFIQILRERKIEVPVAVFSAKPPSDYQEEATALGVSVFIKKPSDLEEIISKIHPLIEK